MACGRSWPPEGCPRSGPFPDPTLQQVRGKLDVEDDVLNISSHCVSDICQLDGADTVSIVSDSSQLGEDDNVSDDSSLLGDETSEGDVSQFGWDEEAYSFPVRAVLVPAPALPDAPRGAPPAYTVDTTGQARAPSCLPLVMVTNARSLKLKMDSLRTMLRQVAPDYMAICETFEATRFDLAKVLQMEHYKVISYRRPPPRVGGGAAIIYTEQNFFVEVLDMNVENGVEACWAIFTPKKKELLHIKRICVGSIYIAPKSKYKQESVDHIVDVMFQTKARFGNDVHFIISGDFNKYPVGHILTANGALKQVLSVPTRKSAILEVILTDLATIFHPPSSLSPLEVDKGKKGSNSDHNIIVFPPSTNIQFKRDRQVSVVKHRPLPPSSVKEFGREIVTHSWIEVLECEDGHQKAKNFHNTITKLRDKYFPEKAVRMTSFDKGWMHPALKSLHSEMTKEFFKNRKSKKWKQLYVNFRQKKRMAIKGMNCDQFAGQLINGSHSNFYRQVKKVSGMKMRNSKLFIASLEGKSDQECAQAIGDEYSATSQAYSPVDLASLPAYLPAQLPPPGGRVVSMGQTKQTKENKVNVSHRPARKAQKRIFC